MDFVQWEHKMNTLNLNNNIKNDIIEIFKEFHHDSSLSFINIENTSLISAFNNVNSYKPITLCLDIEFQSAIINSNQYISTKSIKNDNTAKFIRELGMLFFIKDVSFNIYYIGNLFLNFESLTQFGFDLKLIKLIGSKYADVTEDIYHKMNKLEDNFKLSVHDNLSKLKKNYMFRNFLTPNKQNMIIDRIHKLNSITDPDKVNKESNYINKQLNQIQYEIYGKYLKETDFDIFFQLNKLYWEDKQVLSRIKLIQGKYKLFIDLLTNIIDNSVLVLKGKMDIIAIKNSFKLINKTNIDINHYYDIETFNGISNTLYSSSQLENTYRGIIETDIYQKIAKPLFDEIILQIGDRAHNPVVDSLFTIVVAIAMNLGLNDYFAKKGGYKKEYLKYKIKYLKLKS